MKLLTALAGILFGANATACPKIIGTWQSSKEMSMEYNIKSADLTPTQIEFLNQALGILKITYSQETIINHGAPAIEMVIGNKKCPFEFQEENFKYEIISCTASIVKIKHYYPHTAPEKIKINFIGENTYWVSPSNLPKSREYFTRVPAT